MSTSPQKIDAPSRVFPFCGHEQGMAPLHGPPNGSTPPPSDERARTAALYSEHWRYVRQILPGYGIPLAAQKDLAQSIWMTVHERISTYDAAIHKTPRAWLTGIARRCAANYRRRWKGSPEVLTEDPGALVAAPGLDPEQAALLMTLRQAIRDTERCEALILQRHGGLSVEEIAAATGATESAVEWRLRMAKQDLEDDGKQKSRAFLGFGSLEALTEALRPKPIPDEVGAEDWKEITRRLDAGERPDVNDSEPPPSSIPPPAAVPASAPSGTTTAAATLTKGTIGGLVVVAFIVGGLAGGLLARQAHGRTANVPMEQGLCLAAAPMLTSAPLDAATSPNATSAPASEASAPSTRATRTGAVTSRSSLSEATASQSLRLILQMRHAAEVGNFTAVLALANEHARAFPATDATEREHERRKALEQLKRRTSAGRGPR